jgi:hypothetical protein
MTPTRGKGPEESQGGSRDDFKARDEFAEKLMRDLAGRLNRIVPRDTYGFTLLIFEWGEDGNLFYASTAQREHMLKALEKFIEKERAAARNAEGHG